MQSERPLRKTWVDKELPHVKEWSFGKRAMAIASRECRQRWDEWIDVCSDSNRAFNIAADFWVGRSSSIATTMLIIT